MFIYGARSLRVRRFARVAHMCASVHVLGVASLLLLLLPLLCHATPIANYEDFSSVLVRRVPPRMACCAPR